MDLFILSYMKQWTKALIAKAYFMTLTLDQIRRNALESFSLESFTQLKTEIQYVVPRWPNVQLSNHSCPIITKDSISQHVSITKWFVRLSSPVMFLLDNQQQSDFDNRILWLDLQTFDLFCYWSTSVHGNASSALETCKICNLQVSQLSWIGSRENE